MPVTLAVMYAYRPVAISSHTSSPATASTHPSTHPTPSTHKSPSSMSVFDTHDSYDLRLNSLLGLHVERRCGLDGLFFYLGRASCTRMMDARACHLSHLGFLSCSGYDVEDHQPSYSRAPWCMHLYKDLSIS